MPPEHPLGAERVKAAVQVFVKAAERIASGAGAVRRDVMTILTHNAASRDGALRHYATKPRH